MPKREGHQKTSRKHTQLQEEERKSLSVMLIKRDSSGTNATVSKIAARQGLQVCKGREGKHKFKAQVKPAEPQNGRKDTSKTESKHSL